MRRKDYPLTGNMGKTSKNRYCSGTDTEPVETKAKLPEPKESSGARFERYVNGFFGLLAVPFDLMRSDANGGTERTLRNKERNDALKRFRNGK